MKFYRLCFASVLFLCFGSINIVAGEYEAYLQAIQLAAQQQDSEAIAALSTLAAVLPVQNRWQQRASAAQSLINMRRHQQHTVLITKKPNPHLDLAASYANSHPFKHQSKDWSATLLASIFPGAGHAWLGRWNDAQTAALMVWPILILTFWAFKRGMGPVTVFFALITLWLWSGTVFSAMSLAERGSVEAYSLWWQHIWQASGLPARPW